jgi:arsenite-transporting ATPase
MTSLHPWLREAPRHLFFTGKGGVGKTSLACATAIGLADRGKRVLLISTDPASNLDEVLGVRLASEPTPVPGVPTLEALNINPEASARSYREKIIGPLRGVLPESALRSMEEQLSGACTTEIAAFDEFVTFLAAPSPHDHLIFDTAPTGHTLRLLSLSQAWTGFLDANTSGNSCLGPLAGLEKQRSVYRDAVARLADSRHTELVLVARPQNAALKEARRASAELRALGIARQTLMLNGIFKATAPSDPIAHALETRGRAVLADHASFLESIPALFFPLRAHNLLGVDALRRFWTDNAPASPPDLTIQNSQETATAGDPHFPSLADLVDDLSPAGRGVLLTMGKGGVGKTTLAAAIAHALAQKGHTVHLSTTDPAAHIEEASGSRVPGLTLHRIDPEAETAAYAAEILAAQGPGLSDAGRALLEEDLRSPCTTEIAIFRAFARTVALGAKGFVVLDTAPTGHTLLLLDATEAYHRELGRQSRESTPEEVRLLLPRLRDPEFSRVLIVTLPEATPVHEAAALQDDLRRAGIEPHAWIINQSLTAAGVTDPLLQARAAAETPHLGEVRTRLARRVALVALQPDEPSGSTALAQLLTLPSPICT